MTNTTVLQFPSNYVLMDEEEMIYVDGGEVFTSQQCKNICLALNMTGASLVALAATAAVVSKMIQWAKRIGGFWGWIVGVIAGGIASVVGRIAYGIGHSAISGKSVTIKSTPAFWEYFVSVSWD